MPRCYVLVYDRDARTDSDIVSDPTPSNHGSIGVEVTAQADHRIDTLAISADCAVLVNEETVAVSCASKHSAKGVRE